MSRKSRSNGGPGRAGEWASRVVRLRRKLDLSQSELGRRLNSSAMAVSRWERGVQEPPADVYIQLGNLTGDPECWYFWGRAGLRTEDFMRALPALRRRQKRERLPRVQMTGGHSVKSCEERNDLVVIPLLSQRVGASEVSAEGDLHEVTTEAVLAVPNDWSPHSGNTSAYRVQGNSMAPLICDGYIVVVDTVQNVSEKLYGEVVAASHRDHGIVISRLQAVDGTDVLIPDNRDYKLIPLRMPEWRVLGRVIWWMCSPTAADRFRKRN